MRRNFAKPLSGASLEPGTTGSRGRCRARCAFAISRGLSVAWTCIAFITACEISSPQTDSDAGGDAGGCGELPPFSCNVEAHAVLTPYDEALGCFQPPTTVPDACMSSVGTSCFAGSLWAVCAIAPTGQLYFVTMRGDEDVTGAGWRTTHHRDGYGPTLPSAAMATPADEARCEQARCAKMCAGGDPPYRFFCIAPPDAGAVDASDAQADVASE